MKKRFLYFFATLSWFNLIAQSPATSIAPIQMTAPCLGVIEPMNQPIDQWNFTVQNETVEDGINRHTRKLIEEQTKLKFERIANGEKEKFSPHTPNSVITIEEGKNFSGLGNGLVPFDNGTSVSNGNFVVHTINAKIQISDTTGKILYTNSLATFLGASGLFDPRVLYDSYSDRFIVFCADGKYGVQFACSATNDPTKTWYKYNAKYANASGSWGFADYPYAGVTQHDIILQGATPTPYALQISKQEAYQGATLTTKTYNLSSKCKEMVCMAEHGRPDVTYYKAYLVGSDSWNGGNTLQLVEISDSLAGNPVANVYNISVPAYSLSGDIQQKGSSSKLNSPDTRIQSAVYANGIVHCVMNTNYQNAGFNSVAYYRIDVATKKATAYYYSKPNTDLACPSLALFGTSLSDKSVVIGYQECNGNIYPSIGAVACDDAGNWSNSIGLKSGLGYISGNRYGDYSAMARVHNAKTPTAWFSAEYGGQGNTRSSWICQIKTTDIATSVPEIEVQESFEIYPVPVVDRFTFSMYLRKTLTDASICIYNEEGKLVKNLFDGTLREGENEMGFDKSALPSGIYFIKVFNNTKELKSKKIIIVGN